MIQHFDHLTFVVRDLDRAAASYALLFGRAPGWRGDHPELGTRAALFGLSNALIELVGPRGEEESEGIRAWLAANGEGMQAVAFGTPDAVSCSTTLRARGVRATQPQAGEAHGADGSRRGYSTVDLSPRSTRGLAILAVERTDFEQLRAADTGDAACVEALDHVVIRSADLDAAVQLYEHGLGLRLALDRVVRGTRMLFFRVGGVTIEVVHDAALGSEDAFAGAAYRVRDIAAAHHRIQTAGFGLSEVRDGAKPGTQVFTVRDGTFGVPSLIVRDPSRD